MRYSCWNHVSVWQSFRDGRLLSPYGNTVVGPFDPWLYIRNVSRKEHSKDVLRSSANELIRLSAIRHVRDIDATLARLVATLRSCAYWPLRTRARDIVRSASLTPTSIYSPKRDHLRFQPLSIDVPCYTLSPSSRIYTFLLDIALPIDTSTRIAPSRRIA